MGAFAAVNQLIKLRPNRVYRPFLGGRCIDAWEGAQDLEDGHYGERWIASLVKSRGDGDESMEGLSRIFDGDVTLKSLVEANPEGMLGGAHVQRYGSNLGLLVKCLDAYSRLLIQVHPNQATARRLFNSEYGKTEAWYIIGTRIIDGVDPYILLGFKEGVTRQWYQKQFHQQDIQALEACMHRIQVKEGDLYRIPGGLPHALGSGCFAIEVQEPTDFTIRSEVTAASGEPLSDKMIHQGLGFEAMFDCYDYSCYQEEALLTKYKLKPIIEDLPDGNQVITLIEEPFFTMMKRVVQVPMTLKKKSGFEILMILKGQGHIEVNGSRLAVTQGDEFFVPDGVKSIGLANSGLQAMEVITCKPPKV